MIIGVYGVQAILAPLTVSSKIQDSAIRQRYANRTAAAGNNLFTAVNSVTFFQEALRAIRFHDINLANYRFNHTE